MVRVKNICEDPEESALAVERYIEAAINSLQNAIECFVEGDDDYKQLSFLCQIVWTIKTAVNS